MIYQRLSIVSIIKLCSVNFKHGFQGIALNWFESYLSNMYQKVTFSKLSPLNPVHYGVLQGSVSVPIMFLIYYNDVIITLRIHGHFTIFVDNTTLI